MMDAKKIQETIKSLTEPMNKSIEELKNFASGLEVKLSPEDKKKMEDFKNSNEFKEQERLFKQTVDAFSAFTATFPKG